MATSATLWKRAAFVVLSLPVIVAVAYYLIVEFVLIDPFSRAFASECGACHRDDLRGATLGPALVGGPLRHGDTQADVERAIRDGLPGMPGFSATMDPLTIRQMALFVREQREALDFFDYRIDGPKALPAGIQRTEQHALRVETVVTGIDHLPFSFDILPDGRFLVTEKVNGLFIVDRESGRTEILDTPRAWDAGFEMPIVNVEHGHGWMMEVALHPRYASNGWVYLHYADRCTDCNAIALETGEDVSMNRVDRGRIRDNRWVDAETIWEADRATYTEASDLGAGGRLAFDDSGHVFLSVGLKGANNHHGVQDLSLPYGKVHRVRDDGSIPYDNPFVRPGAEPEPRATIWSYGHRVVQGLEWHPATGELWATEMGPRGGDEINVLRPGQNYGWPLVSLGLDYNGTPVEYGKELGIDPATLDLTGPVADLTPSPAVSSFVVYQGAAFPNWRGHLIVGTLKATNLERFVFDGDQLIHQERLLEGIGRVRDIEIDERGEIYLLMEHRDGSQILRLSPAD